MPIEMMDAEVARNHSGAGTVDPAPVRNRLETGVAIALVLLLCSAHGFTVWTILGGREGISSDWPPIIYDHGIHFHQGLITRHFLKTTGTTAGYDPSFMAGYAASIVSDLSSTFSALFMFAGDSSHPAR